MIVFNDKPGQLCNRIWSYAPFIAQSLKENNKVLILLFGDYAELFENLNCNRNIRFINVNNSFYCNSLKLLFYTLRKIPDPILFFFNLKVDKIQWGKENWPYKTLFDKGNVVFLSGWYHPQYNDYLKKFHPELRNIFRPKNGCVSKIEALFVQKRKEFDRIIGVHIRRSDFKTFIGGAYFFEDEEYAGYMHQLVNDKELKGLNIGFLLCSDEPVIKEHFIAFNIFQVGKAKNIEDLYGLSLCDYIIGPPSTFSMWASFYGKVPLRLFKSGKEEIRIKQFCPIVALDQFENGNTFEHISNDYSYMNKLKCTE